MISIKYVGKHLHNILSLKKINVFVERSEMIISNFYMSWHINEVHPPIFFCSRRPCTHILKSRQLPYEYTYMIVQAERLYIGY